jgi:hypothetical protein
MFSLYIEIMTNVGAQAMEYSGYESGANNALPRPMVTSTEGNIAAYVSKAGGKSRKYRKARKSASRKGGKGRRTRSRKSKLNKN